MALQAHALSQVHAMRMHPHTFPYSAEAVVSVRDSASPFGNSNTVLPLLLLLPGTAPAVLPSKLGLMAVLLEDCTTRPVLVSSKNPSS